MGPDGRWILRILNETGLRDGFEIGIMMPHEFSFFFLVGYLCVNNYRYKNETSYWIIIFKSGY